MRRAAGDSSRVTTVGDQHTAIEFACRSPQQPRSRGREPRPRERNGPSFEADLARPISSLPSLAATLTSRCTLRRVSNTGRLTPAMISSISVCPGIDPLSFDSAEVPLQRRRRVPIWATGHHMRPRRVPRQAFRAGSTCIHDARARFNLGPACSHASGALFVKDRPALCDLGTGVHPTDRT